MKNPASANSWRAPSFVAVLVLGLALVAASSNLAITANAANAPTTQARATIAQGPAGAATSRIVGHTASGRQVTGTFVPLHFIKKNGKVKARGLLQGAVHRADGSVARTFAAMRTLRVKNINGTPVTTRTAQSGGRLTCDVLHLVLAPLDLDLLGLVVHLDRVVLDIVAKSGAGNLLGNLLCAVTGLLDGGLQGLLGRLTNLLNQILGVLRLGA